MWDCHQLIGLQVNATNGEVGRLADLCFDDERWQIRYVIVDTSSRDRQMMLALGVEDVATDVPGDGGTAGSRPVPSQGLAAGEERPGRVAPDPHHHNHVEDVHDKNVTTADSDDRAAWRPTRATFVAWRRSAAIALPRPTATSATCRAS
jgi:hypothetical protein